MGDAVTDRPGAPRVLIVGGGVAGLTLAGLLRRQGRKPVVIERSSAEAEQGGYMLGLYYLGSRVLHGLGLFEEFLERSVPMRRYEIRDGSGALVHRYELEELTRRVGPVRGISRSALIGLLREGLGDLPVRNGTTVRELEDVGGRADVVFSDGSRDRFDLVVAADGLHSDTRGLILREDEFEYRETGWGGWVGWADPKLAPADTYLECWGAGRFVGLYPTADRLGVFFGGPVSEIREAGVATVLAGLRNDLRAGDGVVADVLEALVLDEDPFYWDFHDCRTFRWHSGSVILLGDAATGFLPTAGVGASMAMESAAALADELSRVGAAWVPRAMELYERRHRARVEQAQDSSRLMGRLMFVESGPLAWGRDQIVKLYSLEQLIRSIATMMESPI